VRFLFFRIEGEHLLHANWPLQTANGLQCHRAHANWPSQTAIITNRTVYNAIQPVRRCASAITKKHATQNPEKDTQKRGELDDEASPTFPQEHGVDKYGGTYQVLPEKFWDHQMPNPTSPHGFEWVLGQQRRKKKSRPDSIL